MVNHYRDWEKDRRRNDSFTNSVVGKVNCSHPNKKHVGYYVGIEVFWCAECEIFIEEDIDDNYASIAD